METVTIEQVQRLIDDAIKVHEYESHKNRCGIVFKPPTREEVAAYVREKSLPLDVDCFYDFYESKGWVVGKARMKDWRSACRNAVRMGWCQIGGTGKRAQAKTKLFPISGKNCHAPGCRMPAVYKSTAGAYDVYYCSDHMPEKVKERFE